MQKKILLSFLFLSSCFSFSQEIISSIALDLKKNPGLIQTVNHDNKKVTLYITDKTNVKAIELNEKMQAVDSINAERPDAKTYKQMIGYTASNNSTKLFWSNYENTDILTQTFDFESHKAQTKRYQLNLKDEKIIHKFSQNENFYLLSAIKKSTNLKLYVFDKNGNQTEKIISLEGFHFFKLNYVKSDFYGVMAEGLSYEPPFILQDIDVENPTSLTESASRKKCYVNKNQLVISFDTNVDYTQLMVIDLQQFTAAEKILKTASISNVSNSGFQIKLSSNSFFIDNKIYQIKTSSEIFYLSIKDVDGNLIKEYTATADNPIEFKNTEIYQRGGDFGGERTLENTSQFLRKINNLHTGISCYKIGENTLVTIGGVSIAQQSGGQAVASQFGLIGGILGAVLFNPTMNSFNSYANRKVVKIEGLFDNQQNHVKGDVKPLAFDKIKDFFDKNNDTSHQILYKINEYYLGYYDKKAKIYNIAKFTD